VVTNGEARVISFFVGLDTFLERKLSTLSLISVREGKIGCLRVSILFACGTMISKVRSGVDLVFSVSWYFIVSIQ
jgi:hypothetical protein